MAARFDLLRPMSDTNSAEQFDRLIWIQDFAAHLANLGAPGPMRVLMKLGEDQFDAGEREVLVEMRPESPQACPRAVFSRIHYNFRCPFAHAPACLPKIPRRSVARCGSKTSPRTWSTSAPLADAATHGTRRRTVRRRRAGGSPSCRGGHMGPLARATRRTTAEWRRRQAVQLTLGHASHQRLALDFTVPLVMADIGAARPCATGASSQG
jgi:hypothetical protein